MDIYTAINHLMDKLNDESINSVFTSHNIQKVPIVYTGINLPDKTQYPWPLPSRNLIDVIEHDRVDILEMEYQRMNDDKRREYLLRIVKILDRPYSTVGEYVRRHCPLVRRWIRIQTERFKIRQS